MRTKTEMSMICGTLSSLCASFNMSEKKVSKKEKKCVSEALAAISIASQGFYLKPVSLEHRKYLKGCLEVDGSVKLLAAEIINQGLVHYRKGVFNFYQSSIILR